MQHKSTSIIYLRALSALLIFCCHVAFIAGAFEASMWLNTGVPVFFIISAYLLAYKRDVSSNTKSFYRRRLLSIGPSYWIYLFAVIIVLIAIGLAPEIRSIIIFALGMSGLSDCNILGLGHLWFISVLLICYLLTPLLYYINNSLSPRLRLTLITLLSVIQFIVFFVIEHPSYGIHVGTFILLYSFWNVNGGYISKAQMCTWIFVALSFAILRFLFDESNGNSYYYDALFMPTARFTLAMASFSIFIYNSERIEQWASRHSITHNIVNNFSDHSYEVYLTHQFILLAFWEFIPMFHSGYGLVVWIIVSFIATILNSFLLVYFKKLVVRKLSTNTI